LSGVGFRASGFWLMVEGQRSKDSGFGFRISGVGLPQMPRSFRLGFGFRVSYKCQDGFRVSGVVQMPRVSGFGCRTNAKIISPAWSLTIRLAASRSSNAIADICRESIDNFQVRNHFTIVMIRLAAFRSSSAIADICREVSFRGAQCQDQILGRNVLKALDGRGWRGLCVN